MSFKFSIFGIESNRDCPCDNSENNVTEVKESKSGKLCLQDVLKKCAGNKGEKWKKCLRKHGINKK